MLVKEFPSFSFCFTWSINRQFFKWTRSRKLSIFKCYYCYYYFYSYTRNRFYWVTFKLEDIHRPKFCTITFFICHYTDFGNGECRPRIGLFTPLLRTSSINFKHKWNCAARCYTNQNFPSVFRLVIWICLGLRFS